MARRSMCKRSKDRPKTIQTEFDILQRLLKRVQFRLNRGDYARALDSTELERVKRLLKESIIFLPTGFKAIVSDLNPLQQRRSAYRKICKILRIAGNRPQAAKASEKRVVILRRI